MIKTRGKHFDVKLVMGSPYSNSQNVLFSPKPNDLCHILRTGSRFNLAFMVQPILKNVVSNHEVVNYATKNLGMIEVFWIPMCVSLPSKALNMVTMVNDEYKNYHGPLPIKDSIPVRLYSPTCYVECTPFEASLQPIFPCPRVSQPFRVEYIIKNKTSLNQKLLVEIDEEKNNLSNNDVIVSGLTNGELYLGPMETKHLDYSLVASKSGRISSPGVRVSSTRYGSWVINGGLGDNFLIMP